MSEESNGIAGAVRQHRLFRIATVYAVAGWISIQVADIVLETFESPVWIMQAFLILVLAGFPITLTGVWLVDRTQKRGSSRSLVSIATIMLASLISFGAYQFCIAGFPARRQKFSCFRIQGNTPW